MVKVKIYAEGGGDSERLLSACREGFTAFFERARMTQRMPRMVACGGRGHAIKKFKTAVTKDGSEDISLLLVDSEEPVQGPCCGRTAKEHISTRDNETFTDGIQDHQYHMMVQVMETWFLTDLDYLKSFYGQGFRQSVLPRTNLEDRTKPNVYAALERATEGAKTKGEYGKGKHSFTILGGINADHVTDALPWAKRLVATIDRLMRGTHTPEDGTSY